VQVVAWNSAQGWIACGGERGLLKVLKLDAPADTTQTKGATAQGQGNLSMNQTLEGHQGQMMCVTWNENFRKLSTSDETGLIIVWMLHRGIWFEEMINNRNRSVVRDMKWTVDGQKICIVYEDGAVIVGTVDGQRLWGKEIKTPLAFVEWPPDGKSILFGTLNGEVHVYDNEGSFSHRVPIYCLDEGSEGSVPIAAIHWFELQRYGEATQPALCIAFENGRVQIMRSDTDDKPILIDTNMRITSARWNPGGSTLAIAGMQTSNAAGEKDAGVVQFYAPTGQHLRTLRVPGTSLRSISWEGTGLRIALAVDYHIFFANVRPDHLWGYFAHTLVFAMMKKERNEHAVVFWDMQTDERHTKYIREVLKIASSEEYCTLATKSDDKDGSHVLIVCNAIGSPVESKYLTLEPLQVSMTNTHVCAASEEVIYVWQYRSANAKPSEAGMSPAGIRRRTETVFHIDDTQVTVGSEHPVAPAGGVVSDPIACITASDQCLLVARESGWIHRYSLPHLAVECKFVIRCRPQVIACNCDSTRMSVIDINGMLTVYDVELKPAGTGGEEKQPVGQQLDFERKDVWNMKWASDNPELFAIMEKTRMYVLRRLVPEEPVLSNASICSFKQLQIEAVCIDDVMRNQDVSAKEVLLDFETKSLRDTRDILTKVSNLKDAYNYIEDNPHPRLWRLFAETALEQLELAWAEKAFVRYEDYQGIQFVKRLKLLDDKVKQKAEVHAYFQHFDEAELLYREIDRKDLAIHLRERLGDWFRVIQLARPGPTEVAVPNSEQLLTNAYSSIGDYYADRSKWVEAKDFYAKAQNGGKLVEAYYILEDYTALSELAGSLNEGDPLLMNIGNKFSTVGLCENAVDAYVKAGDVKAAVDCCVLLNFWSLAVDLATQHNFQQIEGLLAKYASHLLEKDKKIEAVQLYRKANRHTEAAKLLSQIAQGIKGGVQKHPLRLKKLYLLSALEVESFKTKTLDMSALQGGTKGTMGTQATLTSLITQDQSVASDKALSSPWRGAEALHLYLLAQRQLSERQFDAAMKTAIRLGDYEDIVDTETIFSLVALTAYHNKYYQQCSKAFIKLEHSESIPAAQREKYGDLALSIFVMNPPRDPSRLMKTCQSCQASLHDWQIQCHSCYRRLEFCVVTGRSIFPDKSKGGVPSQTAQDEVIMGCKTCRHKMYQQEARRSRHCPLCHSRLVFR